MADSRPRVRGRFAKNDDYCEASRAIGSQNHDDYEQMVILTPNQTITDSLKSIEI